MFVLTRSLSAKRSIAVPMLAAVMRAPALPIRVATAVSLPWVTNASATCSDTPARPAIASCFGAEPPLTSATRSCVGEHRGVDQDGQRHRLDVAGETQRHVVRQLRGAAQAMRQGAPDRQFGVLSHDADDVVGDPKLGCGQLGAVDLARQLVRHLGTGRGGRLSQQTCNVGLRKG